MSGPPDCLRIRPYRCSRALAQGGSQQSREERRACRGWTEQPFSYGLRHGAGVAVSNLATFPLTACRTQRAKPHARH